MCYAYFVVLWHIIRVFDSALQLTASVSSLDLPPGLWTFFWEVIGSGRGPTDRQRQTDRQADRQTDRQTDKQTDIIHTMRKGTPNRGRLDPWGRRGWRISSAPRLTKQTHTGTYWVQLVFPIWVASTFQYLMNTRFESTNRKTDEQTDRQTDRQADRQTDRDHTHNAKGHTQPWET